MTEVANTTTNYLSPGSICWAAFLAMGARLENSPNDSLTDITIPRKHRPFGHPTDEQTARLRLSHNADETFTSPYLSDTLGIGHNSRSSRARTRYKARYNDDNNDNNHNENKEKTPPACVCRNDTQHEATDSPQPPHNEK